MNKLPQIRSVRVRMLVVLLPLLAVAIGALTLMAINRATAAETESRFSEMRQIAAVNANEFDADAHANQALGRSLAAMMQGLGDGVTRTQVNAAVEQFQDRNPDLAGFLVSNGGIFVSALDEELIGTSTLTKLADDKGNAELRAAAKAIAAGKGGQVETTDPFTGKPILLSWAPVGTGDWGFVTAVPVDEVLAPIEAMRNGLILIGLVLLLLAGGEIALFATRLTRPIAAVTAAAEKVSEGDVEATVEVSTKDEIGRLAAAFAGTVASLREKAGPPSGSPRAISPSRSSRARSSDASPVPPRACPPPPSRWRPPPGGRPCRRRDRVGGGRGRPGSRAPGPDGRGEPRRRPARRSGRDRRRRVRRGDRPRRRGGP